MSWPPDKQTSPWKPESVKTDIPTKTKVFIERLGHSHTIHRKIN